MGLNKHRVKYDVFMRWPIKRVGLSCFKMITFIFNDILIFFVYLHLIPSTLIFSRSRNLWISGKTKLVLRRFLKHCSMNNWFYIVCIWLYISSDIDKSVRLWSLCKYEYLTKHFSCANPKHNVSSLASCF